MMRVMPSKTKCYFQTFTGNLQKQCLKLDNLKKKIAMQHWFSILVLTMYYGILKKYFKKYFTNLLFLNLGCILLGVVFLSF